MITLNGLHFINVKAINLEYGDLVAGCVGCGWGGVIPVFEIPVFKVKPSSLHKSCSEIQSAATSEDIL